MKLKERIEADTKEALKNRDHDRLSALRMLLSEIHNAEIEKRGELAEEEVIEIIAREMKKWEEAAEEYERVGQQSHAKKERFEADVLRAYLPPPLSEEEIKALIKETISEVEAKGPRDMGKVMRAIIPKIVGRADKKKVSEMTREMLEA
ncbi:MAG: GatB/YqeY domain-containing protein [Actinomycetota bacterium]|nr:GatB/YqeY domain-containing protein [Actinomycetota bacterium]MDI6821463.1 GatB/YqeY domain-containing protein [Actinomycetota bacterium]